MTDFTVITSGMCQHLLPIYEALFFYCKLFITPEFYVERCLPRFWLDSIKQAPVLIRTMWKLYLILSAVCCVWREPQGDTRSRLQFSHFNNTLHKSDTGILEDAFGFVPVTQQTQRPTSDNHKQSLGVFSSQQLTDKFHLSS